MMNADDAKDEGEQQVHKRRRKKELKQGALALHADVKYWYNLARLHKKLPELYKQGLKKSLGVTKLPEWHEHLHASCLKGWQRNRLYRYVLEFVIPYEFWDLNNELETTLAFHYTNTRVYRKRRARLGVPEDPAPEPHSAATYARMISQRKKVFSEFTPPQRWSELWTKANCDRLVASIYEEEALIVQDGILEELSHRCHPVRAASPPVSVRAPSAEPVLDSLALIADAYGSGDGTVLRRVMRVAPAVQAGSSS